MINYYDFLNVSPSASQDEVNQAVDRQYDHWPRLVIHHDQAIVEQANQSLRFLEQIRNILATPAARNAYDVGLGIKETTFGITDPGAILFPSSPSSLRNEKSQQGPQVTQSTTNGWICDRCKALNRVGLKFCASCGEQLGINCLNCGELIRVSDIFCAECGENLEESKTQVQERSIVKDWIDQTKKDLLQLKHLPTIRAVIATGSFQDVYKVCFETKSAYREDPVLSWK
jgi:hypothetical protein